MKKLNEIFGIDLRALAVFRVCLGLIILYDISTRIPDLTTFYSDAGLLPRLSLITNTHRPEFFSLHLISGAGEVQAALLLVQAICAIGLLCGFNSRWMIFFSWLLMVSLNRRNHLANGAGDDYFRLLLFWSMFLPLGARFSLDRLLDHKRIQLPVRVFNWASAALLLQIAGGYLVSGCHKWPLAVWHDGTAVYYALSIDNYAKDLGQLLLGYPTLTQFLTHATLWLELIGPFLLFCPLFFNHIRLLTCAAFISLQIGFYLTMYLMLFPLAGLAAMIVFLPSPFWDASEALFLQIKPATLRFLKPIREKPLWTRCESMLKRYLFNLPAGPVRVDTPIYMNLIIILLMICVTMWNLDALRFKNFTMPKVIRYICLTADLNQAWRMFAPPALSGGWFVVPGKLRDGTEIDLFNNGSAVNWEKPSLQDMFKNERWRRYMFSYVFGKNKNYWVDYGRYLCRSWNENRTDQKQLESLEIIFMARKTPPPGETADYQKKVLFRHVCLDKSTPSLEANHRSTETAPDYPARPPAVNGMFYPKEAVALKRAARSLIQSAQTIPLSGELVALLVPHAAYRYSGVVAGHGYKNMGKNWKTIILIGPSHRTPITNAAVWARGAFSTPLGEVPIDEELAQKLIRSSPLIIDSALPHQTEHSLEVQLPFLQETLGDFKIVPILISSTDLKICRQVGEAIARVARDEDILILISSDLSHYPNKETARKIDEITLGAINQMDPEIIKQTANQLMETNKAVLKTPACGQGAILAGLYAAKLLGAGQALTLKYMNSADTQDGDPNRVVGYASVAFLRNPAEAQPQQGQSPLNASARQYLLSQASHSIQEALNGNLQPQIESPNDPLLYQKAGLFVTIEINGRLRGCRGTTSASRTLLNGVNHFAREAAFNDPRFPPLTKEEFERSRLKISLLSSPENIDSADQIIPGRHGVILRQDNKTGLFLPSVWKKIPEKENFLNELCTQKARLPADCWKDPQTTLSIFTTFDFHD